MNDSPARAAVLAFRNAWVVFPNRERDGRRRCDECNTPIYANRYWRNADSNDAIARICPDCYRARRDVLREAERIERAEARKLVDQNDDNTRPL